MKSLKLIIVLLSIAKFSQIEMRTFTICELVEELHDNHTISRENIYKHLCIVGNLMQTKNKFNNDFHGIYRIGGRWWCGEEQKGGGCDVKCEDLNDDHIADDVRCAEIILLQQGVQGWGQTENDCNRRFSHKVDECLETFDELTEELPAITTSSSTTTTTEINLHNRLSEVSETSKSIESENSSNVSLNLNIILSFLLLALLVVTIVMYFKYQAVLNYMRNSITTTVQMSVGRENPV